MKTSASWLSLVVMVGIWAASCSGDDSKGTAAATGGDAPGGMGGEPSVERLKLVDRSPQPGEDNVWTLAPIELEFSHPIEEASLEGAVHLQVRGEDVAFTSSLEEEGRLLRLELAEVPPLPARIEIQLDDSLVSTEGLTFAGDGWTWDYPLWQAPTAPSGAPVGVDGGLGLAVLDDTTIVAAFPEEGAVHVSRLVDGAWVDVPSLEQEDDAADVVVLSVFGDELDEISVVWLEAGSDGEVLHAARFDGDAWEPVGGGSAATGDDLRPQVRRASDGSLVMAYVSAANAVTVLREEDGDWAAPGPDLAADGVQELALALDDADEPLVAFVDDTSTVHVSQFQGNVWVPLDDAGIPRQRTGPAEPRLAWVDGQAVLAYLDGDDVSMNVQVARFDDGWSPLGGALDVEIDAEATSPRLLVTTEGDLVTSWREVHGESDRVFVARQRGDHWQVLGSSPGSARGSTAFALDADGDGNVHVGWVAVADDEVEVHLRRFNGSPVLPSGLSRLGDRGACDIPADDDPDFPETLTATGCYDDLTTRSLVEAAIPYSINSVLWSDGAAKKRYVLLPEKDGELETVDYVSAGALGFPVGTILIKEFYLEQVVGDPTTLFPVETRFLVKRCEEGSCAEPWQGYSYEWNVAGTEGTLLEGASSKAWAVTQGGEPSSHTHLYPSRVDCARCHNEPAGRVLGLQSKQLNRAHDYGHTVDNQLRAWIAAGLLEGAPADAAEELPRLPQPADVGRSLDERARAYFHSNCAHCHRAGGENIAIDFRFEAPLAEDNICNKVTPGNHETSPIWQRDQARGVGGDFLPMPPLATDLPDARQLAVTAAWIDAMPETCP